MTITIIYPTVEQIINLHKKVITISGGGANAILNQGQLESVLSNIQNDDYYPNFHNKLTHLTHSICKFHCFEDGNKRTSLVSANLMLTLNNYLHCLPHFFERMENYIVYVAERKIDKQLLEKILLAIIENDFSESLKLEIIGAVQ